MKSKENIILEQCGLYTNPCIYINILLPAKAQHNLDTKTSILLVLSASVVIAFDPHQIKTIILLECFKG